MFATHYHELTELEGAHGRGSTTTVSLSRNREMTSYSCERSSRAAQIRAYGIQVAKLAGVPDSGLSARAKELVQELSDADIANRAKEVAQYASASSGTKNRVQKLDEVDANQLTLFDTVKDDDIVKEITSMDLSTMTPIDALNTLYRMQAALKNRI